MKVLLLCVAVACCVPALQRRAAAQPVNLWEEEEEDENQMDIGEAGKKSGEAVAAWTESSPMNPEELSQYPGGDVLLPIRRGRGKRQALRQRNSVWPDAIIPYEISPEFSNDSITAITNAIDAIKLATCLRFIPRTQLDIDYVYFSNQNTGCWSTSVGKLGGRQDVNLQSPGCLSKIGTAMHEMMHVAGFIHEQSRPDRDRYVTINEDNIDPKEIYNFDKNENLDIDSIQNEVYDFGSVMHYSAYAFSNNGQPTIVPKYLNVEIGQRERLSHSDMKRIRLLYNCPNN